MTQIELTITTETYDGETYRVIDQSGEFGTGEDRIGAWTAEAFTDDHHHIDITATVRDEAGLDQLIADLETLRTAVRQIHDVYSH